MHFAVDPGPAWQWGSKSNIEADKSLSTSDKLRLLDQYMNLVKIPISISRTDDLSDQQMQAPTRSSNGLKMPSENPVRHERGSFGKKLKYFAKLEKPKNGSTPAGDKSRIGPVSLAELEDPTIIVGAKMSERRHQLQYEMIKNYIDKAKERFEEERRLKRLLKEEVRHQQEQLANVQQNPHLAPPVNWDDKEVYRTNPDAQGISQGYHWQDQGYPEPYRRSNQQQTHLNAYQTPVTHTRSNPVPYSQLGPKPQYRQPTTSAQSSQDFQNRPIRYQQPQYHQPSTSSQSYQHSYQLDAPAEATVLVNQVNVQPPRQGANRQPAHDKRSGAITHLVQGIHQLQPTSVYQQTRPRNQQCHCHLDHHK